MKIAMMYICTGKYELFWDEYYRTSEKYFYPDCKKHYFVFTESKRVMSQKLNNVTFVYQARVGWPYDTLLRFHWFSMVQDQISQFDYCYYCNANTVFLKKVTPDVIPFPTEEKPLLLWCHTQHYDHYSSNDITTEKNPASTAYVGENVPCRAHGGSFFGGTGKGFLKLTLDLRNNVQVDLNNGIIAVWHDQSHLIKYGSEHEYLEVGRDLICHEHYKPVEGVCVMYHPNKDNGNGGIDNLRNNGLGPRMRHAVIKCYGTVLKGADAVGLGNGLRKVTKLFPNRRSWYR